MECFLCRHTTTTWRVPVLPVIDMLWFEKPPSAPLPTLALCLRCKDRVQKIEYDERRETYVVHLYE